MSMTKLVDCYSHILNRADDDETTLILLESLWPQIVGKEVALWSYPYEFTNGNLFIGVSDPDWEKELNGMTIVLKRAINTFWGKELVIQTTISPI